jgi:Ras-related protein Rab-28
VVLAYDITNADSFANLEDWLAECRAVFKDAMPYLALVGNKTDLGHLRTVKPQRHKDFADASGMHSFFVSAKSGDNVAAMFYRIAADLAGVTLTKPELQVGHGAVCVWGGGRGGGLQNELATLLPCGAGGGQGGARHHH